MAIRARYRGNGNEHINGVPMADIDEDAWQQLDSEQRALVRTVKRADGKLLYDVSTDKEMSGAHKAPAAVAEPDAEPEAATPPPDEGSGA